MASVSEFIFYLPSVLALGCPIVSLVFIKVRDKILYECAYRIASNLGAEEERTATESFINTQLSQKWYYKVCPNCGAPASAALKQCKSCGSSLEVLEGAQNISSMRRISDNYGQDNSLNYLDREVGDPDL